MNYSVQQRVRKADRGLVRSYSSRYALQQRILTAALRPQVEKSCYRPYRPICQVIWLNSVLATSFSFWLSVLVKIEAHIRNLDRP